MRNVVFVAPYFLPATERFLRAVAELSGVRLGLVSCDPSSKLPSKLRDRLDAHYAVSDTSTAELLRGVQALRGHFGSVDRLVGMLEQIQVPLGEIRDQLGIEGMSAGAALNFRDKSRMKSELARAGIPCARHALVVDLDQAVGFANQVGYPLVIKPPDGAGAKGTFRCENRAGLVECLESLRPSQRQPAMIEEFITGEEHSLDSVCVAGRMVWHSISRYLPAPLEVIREPWIQWCVLLPREMDEARFGAIQELAEPALQALGMRTGLSHMEWFRRPDGTVAVSEVGARPPGAQITSLLSFAHDVDLYRAWARLMAFDQFDPPQRKFACGAAYLRGMGQGRVSGVQGLRAVAEQLGDLVVEAKLPELGQLPSGSYEGEGYVIVRHPETDVVETALRTIISNVRVALSDLPER